MLRVSQLSVDHDLNNQTELQRLLQLGLDVEKIRQVHLEGFFWVALGTFVRLPYSFEIVERQLFFAIQKTKIKKSFHFYLSSVNYEVVAPNDPSCLNSLQIFNFPMVVTLYCNVHPTGG